jgi:hypothetical protein
MAGLPGIDSLADYGDAKSDFAPVEDPTTDESAEHRNLYAANVAAMTQTVCRAWVAFTGHAVTPVDPDYHIHGAVWGDTAGVKPTVVHDSTGVYVIEWPEEVDDELLVEHTVNLRRCSWNVEGATPYTCTATVTAPNEVTLRVFDMAGAANDGVATVFTVYVIPRRFGGGRNRLQDVHEDLNADRGTAFDASNRDTTVYVENMALARGISAAWGTNERLGRLWDPPRMSEDIVARWEKILALAPAPDDTMSRRRGRLLTAFERFGSATISSYVQDKLSAELGDAFVGVEYIGPSAALIQVPDLSYPWGIVGSSPWSSTVAHVLVRLQKPDGWTDSEFYETAGKVSQVLEPAMPIWTTFEWYRPGPISAPVADGASAAGFYLDDEANLDNQVFDE